MTDTEIKKKIQESHEKLFVIMEKSEGIKKETLSLYSDITDLYGDLLNMIKMEK